MTLGFLALTLATLVGFAQCGQLSVLFAPPSVRFQSTNEELPESHVISVLQSVFGLPTQQNEDWNGLLEGDFFARPKALVLFSISGASADQLNVTGDFIYDTLEDNREPLSMQQMAEGLKDLSLDGRSVLFIDLVVDKYHRAHLHSGGQLPRVINLQLLASSPKIYVELHAIRETIATLASSFHKIQSDTPDLYHFHISGLEYLADRYGPKSVESLRAINLLQDTLRQASSVFGGLYEDNLVMLALCQTTSRRAGSYPPSPRSVQRKLLQQNDLESQQTTPAVDEFIVDLNLAPEFTWMYPPIFNIALWFMFTFSCIIFGVSWCIWFTDPGRDGVIYRMTTHHIKNE